jgi:hypothetical protein
VSHASYLFIGILYGLNASGLRDPPCFLSCFSWAVTQCRKSENLDPCILYVLECDISFLVVSAFAVWYVILVLELIWYVLEFYYRFVIPFFYYYYQLLVYVVLLTEVYCVYEGVSRLVGHLVASSRIIVSNMFGRVLVVNLYIIARYFIDVELLYSVHLPACIGWTEDFQNTVYCPSGMPLFQEVHF